MKIILTFDKKPSYTPLASMAINQRTETVDEDGEKKEAFVVTFTNGAKQQLEELKDFFNVPDLLEIVRLGISVLQRTKEASTPKQEEEK